MRQDRKHDLRGWISGAVLAGALSASATGQELLGVPPAGNDRAWDCWLSAELRPATVSTIRCIRGSDGSSPQPAPDAPTAALLDHVRDMIRRGETRQLNADIDRGLLTELYGHIWRIRLAESPDQETARERRPQRAVQGILCPRNPDCRVLVQR